MYYGPYTLFPGTRILIQNLKFEFSQVKHISIPTSRLSNLADLISHPCELSVHHTIQSFITLIFHSCDELIINL